MGRYIISSNILFDSELFAISLYSNDASRGTSSSLRSDKLLRLSHMETKILMILCDNAGQVVTRNELLDNAWSNGTGTDGHLNRLILLLRRKFESLGTGDVINTMPRVGYYIEKVAFIYADSADSADTVVYSLVKTTPALEEINKNEHTYCNTEVEGGLSSTLIKNCCGSNKIKKYKFALIAVVFFIFLFFYTYQQFTAQDFSPEIKSHKGFVLAYLQPNLRDGDLLSINGNVENVITKNIDTDKPGQYYVGISDKAISVVYEENGRSKAKKIFIRNEGNLLDVMQCALKESSKPSNQGDVAHDVTSIAESKSTSYLVYFGCPFEDRATTVWKLSLAYTTDKLGRRNEGEAYYIADIELLNTTMDDNKKFEITVDGTFDHQITGTFPQTSFRPNRIILNRTTPPLSAVPSDTVRLAILKDYDERNYADKAFFIHGGLYFSGFLNGTFISFN